MSTIALVTDKYRLSASGTGAAVRLLEIVAERAEGRPIHAAIIHAPAVEEAERIRQYLAGQCHQVKQRLQMPKLVSVCGGGFHRQKRQALTR